MGVQINKFLKTSEVDDMEVFGSAPFNRVVTACWRSAWENQLHTTETGLTHLDDWNENLPPT